MATTMHKIKSEKEADTRGDSNANVACVDNDEAERWRAYGCRLRDYARKAFRESLGTCAKDSELTERELDKMSINGELGIMNMSVRRCREKSFGSTWLSPMFRKVYKWKLQGVLFNLKNGERNPGLIRKIIEKEYPTRALAFMSPRVLFPELWDPLIDDCLKREWAKPEPIVGGLIKCRFCKKDQTVFNQLQTRSGDEGLTTYVTCYNPLCGKRFKFS
jgi:DNA-directed RNA polymerase subunit M/transcription elongation factor TFIIS